MRKILAFTLAETLIVMGIIGIVSALTLPNLNSSTGEKEKVAKIMKLYRDLNDAHGRVSAVYGPIDEWIRDAHGNSDDEKLFERVTEFLKVSKSDVNNLTAILADGTELKISANKCVDNSSHYGSKFCGYLITDIDGPNKGKNKLGVDIFRFDLLLDGVYPDGMDSSTGKNACVMVNNEPYSCTRWIVENGNMDYLKCNDKLKWGQQISCK